MSAKGCIGSLLDTETSLKARPMTDFDFAAAVAPGAAESSSR